MNLDTFDGVRGAKAGRRRRNPHADEENTHARDLKILRGAQKNTHIHTRGTLVGGVERSNGSVCCHMCDLMKDGRLMR